MEIKEELMEMRQFKFSMPLPELVDEHIALFAEVKRLREQNKLMVDYFRFMRDGGLTDEDWRTINEWIGDEEE
tara:strand:+ start:876 stop:1094 length:219 start_codon:yes stop_codon:yes gene_type:complete